MVKIDVAGKIETTRIIGAGAVGGAMAAMLHDAGEAVSLLAAGPRRERLLAEELTVNGRPYAMPIIDTDGPGGPADFIIVAVKHHDLDAAIRQMARSVGPETIVMSLMNGVDSEERIGRVYGEERVLPAVIVGIDALREGNRITYSNKGKIFFGDPAGGETERTGRVRALFDRAAIPYEIPADIRRTIWWKFMINVGINQASAALLAPYGVFQRPGEARSLMESAMREAIAIAGKMGVSITSADLADWDRVLAGLRPEGKTSMLQDVEARRKTEVEMLAGKVIELGRRFGVPTPVNERLFDIITKIEASYA